MGGNRSNLVEGDVRTISQRRHGNLATGAKWGFGIGAAFGLLVDLTECTGDECRLYSPFIAALYGGLGSGIGVGVSASIINQHVIFAKLPTASVKLTLSPLVTHNRQGMMVSLGF